MVTLDVYQKRQVLAPAKFEYNYKILILFSNIWQCD